MQGRSACCLIAWEVMSYLGGDFDAIQEFLVVILDHRHSYYCFWSIVVSWEDLQCAVVKGGRMISQKPVESWKISRENPDFGKIPAYLWFFQITLENRILMKFYDFGKLSKNGKIVSGGILCRSLKSENFLGRSPKSGKFRLRQAFPQITSKLFPKYIKRRVFPHFPQNNLDIDPGVILRKS